VEKKIVCCVLIGKQNRENEEHTIQIVSGNALCAICCPYLKQRTSPWRFLDPVFCAARGDLKTLGTVWKFEGVKYMSSHVSGFSTNSLFPDI
jgi:hypothetical protein